MQSFDLTPQLNPDEATAIADSLNAVALMYADDFEHWPLVALALSMSAPIAPRLMAKRARDARDAEIKALATPDKDAVKTAKVAA